MTDAEELRSDALMHAIMLYGPMSPGDDTKNAGDQVLKLASLFALFISEGPAVARRVLENGLDTAEVIRLVPAPAATDAAGVQGTHAEDHSHDIE